MLSGERSLCATLSSLGTNTLPPAFADTVLDSLDDLFDELEGETKVCPRSVPKDARVAREIGWLATSEFAVCDCNRVFAKSRGVTAFKMSLHLRAERRNDDLCFCSPKSRLRELETKVGRMQESQGCVVAAVDALLAHSGPVPRAVFTRLCLL